MVTGDSGSLRFEVRIPRDAPLIEIRSGERRLFLSEHGVVTTDGPLDGTDAWLLALEPAP